MGLRSESHGEIINNNRNKIGNNIQRTTAFSETMNIFKAEGIRGMYRGIIPELLKVTPMVGITFCMYEFVIDMID